MKRYFSLILIVALLLFSFTACGSDSNITPNSFHSNTPGDNVSGSSSDVISGSENSTLTEAEFTVTASDMFTKRDKKTEYDNSAVRIQLNGSSATADSDKVQISDSTVTITEEDTYILSGTLDDGTIIVNADNSAKLHLIFDNVSINSNDSAAILVLSADKVIVTLASEQNRLSNGGIFTTIDDININAVLYSKEDLSLNGSGSLTINSPAGHGISCKDDLVLAGGTYTITAANHGLDANDSIRLTSSAITIAAGKDGMHAENSDDATLGFVYIADGTYQINAQDDGIHAGSTLTILDGDINITESYEGLEALDLVINGGNIRLIASDDGLNAADPATNNFDDPGKNDFGRPNDDPAASPDTSFPVPGVSEELTPETGTNHRGNRPGKIKGDFSDFPDGSENLPPDVIPDRNMQNRPNGNFGGGFDNKFSGGFGGGTFGGMSSSNGSITITGGTLYLQASGDGIDANGSLTITGGDITICGPNRGDTASLDYDTTATISDATFIATGATGMAQTLSSSEQGIITINVGNQNAGTTLTLTDSKGKVLLSQTPELPYSLVILSSPDLVSGESYTLTYGTTTKTITAQ